MRPHAHFVNERVAIGGGFRSFRRRIEKEVNRGVDKVTDAVSDVGSSVSNEVRRFGSSIDAERRRTMRNVENLFDEAGEEIDQFVRQTGKNGILGHALADFNRNPEYWYAIGSVLVMVPGPWSFVGMALIAAASVRIERNKRKLAEKLGHQAAPPVSDGDLPWGTDPMGAAAEFIRRHPVAIAAGLAALWFVTRRSRRK